MIGAVIFLTLSAILFVAGSTAFLTFQIPIAVISFVFAGAFLIRGIKSWIS